MAAVAKNKEEETDQYKKLWLRYSYSKKRETNIQTRQHWWRLVAKCDWVNDLLKYLFAEGHSIFYTVQN
jgi:hypothetical protein